MQGTTIEPLREIYRTCLNNGFKHAFMQGVLNQYHPTCGLFLYYLPLFVLQNSLFALFLH